MTEEQKQNIDWRLKIFRELVQSGVATIVSIAFVVGVSYYIYHQLELESQRVKIQAERLVIDRDRAKNEASRASSYADMTEFLKSNNAAFELLAREIATSAVQSSESRENLADITVDSAKANREMTDAFRDLLRVVELRIRERPEAARPADP